MACRIQPTQDRIVVRRIAPRTMSGGILIPDSAQEKQKEAEVVAVGPGRREDGKRVPMELMVGDRILLTDYNHTEIQVDGEDLLILNEGGALAKVPLTKAAKK